eukprot:tig00020965_g16819.t1
MDCLSEALLERGSTSAARNGAGAAASASELETPAAATPRPSRREHEIQQFMYRDRSSVSTNLLEGWISLTSYLDSWTRLKVDRIGMHLEDEFHMFAPATSASSAGLSPDKRPGGASAAGAAAGSPLRPAAPSLSARRAAGAIALRTTMHRMQRLCAVQCFLAVCDLVLSITLTEYRYATRFDQSGGSITAELIMLANGLVIGGLRAPLAIATPAHVPPPLSPYPPASLGRDSPLQRAPAPGKRILALESIVLCVFCPPFTVSFLGDAYFYIEGALSSFTVVKSYLFLRHARGVPPFRARPFKIAMVADPWRVLMVLFTLTVLACTYLIWICDRCLEGTPQ